MNGEEQPVSDKTIVAPMEPIRVTVVGTPRDASAPKRQLVETPQGQRDVVIQFISPVMSVVARFIDTFLTILVAGMTAASATNIIPFTDLKDLTYKTSGLALSGALVGFAKDLIVLVGRLKKRFPLLDA